MPVLAVCCGMTLFSVCLAVVIHFCLNFLHAGYRLALGFSNFVRTSKRKTPMDFKVKDPRVGLYWDFRGKKSLVLEPRTS